MATEASVSPALLAQAPSRATLAGSVSGPATWRRLTLGLVALDTGGLLFAFALAYIARFKTGLPLLDTPPYSGSFYSSIAFWAVPAWVGLLAFYRLYDRRYLFAGLQEYMRVANACTAGVLVLVLISFLDKSLLISRGWLVLTWLLAIVTVVTLRFAARRLLRFVRARGLLTTPTVIVGANEEGVALAEQFLADPGCGVRVVGFVDVRRPAAAAVVGPLQILGGLNNLREIVRDWGVHEVVVATTAVSRDELLDLYRTVGQDEQIVLRLSSGLFEILATGVQVEEISCVPLMTPHRTRITGGDALFKAIVDYVMAALVLLATAPALLAIAVLVRFDSPGPALHRRRVLGVSGKPFDAFKFRTMVINADEVLARDAQLRASFDAGYKLRRDPRVTRVGRFLRRTSVDELPQLLNVLRGEMSLVGPRMIAPDEAARYGKWQLNLLTVKPGITGPWQVEGRGDLPYDQRVQLSMQYIRNHSLWLDLAILLRTVVTVLRGRGAY